MPYLEPACGDHKIIWELNRHQHWLALGRAAWLTGDPRYRARFLAELASWRDANPPLIGVNWASMLELAFRSISWLWAIHLFADGGADDAWPWLVDLLVGLDRQLSQIERNLSYYFSPNTHLTGEALALYVAGRVLPELAASARRADTGRRVLLREIDRQIAGDGGHCERSIITTATRSTSTPLPCSWRARPATRPRRRGSRTRSSASDRRRDCSPTIAAACRTSATTTAAP